MKKALTSFLKIIFILVAIGDPVVIFGQINLEVEGDATISDRLAIGAASVDTMAKVNIRSGDGINVSNWIALAAGSADSTSGRVVMGNLFGTATIGAHTGDLLNWSTLSINPDGGNVGVGTRSPLSKLHVVGNTRLEGPFNRVQSNNNSGTWLSIGNTTPGGRYFNIISTGLTNSEGVGKLIIIPSTAPAGGPSALTIDGTSRNIGIGTNVPQASLDVRGPTHITSSVSQNLLRAISPSAIGSWFTLGNTSGGGKYWQFISTGSGNVEGSGKLLISAGDSPIAAASSGVHAIVCDADGRVGIGTDFPAWPLQIVGSDAGGANSSPAHYLHHTVGVGSSGAGWNYSVHASSGFYSALGFGTGSDARIKNIIGQSIAKNDLETLMKIQITDYTHKDELQYGNESTKKVIAQQVEMVYPQAISKNRDVVPDIFQKSQVKDGWILLTTELKIGERVKIITEKEQRIYTVTESKPDRFKVDKLVLPIKNGEHSTSVFVYGREVDDFRSVDYDAISMLHVSATQAQQEIIDAQQKEIEQLKFENTQMKNDISEIKALLVN